MMKVMRYSASGNTHKKGTEATFWVMWLLTASRSADPIPGSNSHRPSAASATGSTGAAGCAVDAGKAVEYHSAIFASQPKTEGAGYSDAALVALGDKAGITGAAKVTFDDCIASGRYRQWAVNSYLQFIKKNLSGTPTLAINGVVQDNSVFLINSTNTGVDTTGKALWAALVKAGAK